MKKRLSIAVLVILVAIVGWHLFITYDNKFPYGRMWETPAVRPYENRPLLMASGIVPFEGGEAVFRATPAEKLHSPLTEAVAEQVKEGKKLYFTYCAQCHGKYHDGNGTVGQSFHPLPTDVRSANVQNTREGVLFKEISYGIPNGKQPALATTIGISDRWRIIAYIKSLGPRP
jgi:mono/diheme cytochrome c family protein